MAHTQKKQHATSTPFHVRWAFLWPFRALMQGGPPLFISSFLSPPSVVLFLFCNIKTNRNRENYTFGRRRSFGRVVSSSDIARILLPSCGSNRTFFFKHHRSQDRLSYCAAFSNLGVGVSRVEGPRY